ncbi:DNA-binding beta-propeller fold protein YncE [Hymenobacter daecheongensis DSM 21074]|uniref:DNA-binding beta-propeller fold protein YncE n=1 Tax=Hymenobacter daecheongensis DSM 21074 TaxID=1121955 RepID=A0A1M6I8N8_9BACT|nr:tail fiber domain-containing protein [Hymenobacter daecheongensis]SHJ30795.1 DNA-binding beta-propeller fold protein YncE [Hymenobacter daecheongensis DSM 21074]
MQHRYLLAPLAALLLLAATPQLALAQTTPTGAVGIGTTAPDASAALDIVSSGKGVLLPRVAAATAIASPAPGLLVYQTGAPAGFYYNAGTSAAPSWQRLATGSAAGDNLGNHTATQALNLNGQKLTGGGTNGLRVATDGSVAVDALAGTGQGRLLTAAPDGTLQASAPLQSQPLATTAPDPALLGSASTGNGPFGVAVNTAGTRAYVVNRLSNTLQAYDLSGGVAPVPLGNAVPTGLVPLSVALNGAGSRAYVVNYTSNTLQVYDLSGGGAPVPLGGSVTTDIRPMRVVVNAAGTRAYVAARDGDLLQTYDVSGSGPPVPSGSPVTGMPLYASDLALNQAGTRLYVAARDAYALQTYDVSGGGAPVLLGSGPMSPSVMAVAVNAAGTRAYTVDEAGNALQAHDISSNAPVLLGNAVAAGGDPSDVAVNAAGTRAYVTNGSGNSLQTFDLSTGGIPVALGNAVRTGNFPYQVALNVADTRAYVVNYSGGTLQAFNIEGTMPTVVGLGTNGSLGTFSLGQLADNLGNHTATRNLNLAGFQLVGGGSSGLAVSSAGNVGIGTSGAPSQRLEVAGNVRISGTGNGLTFPDGSTQTSASAAGNLVGDVTSAGTTTTYAGIVPATKGGAGTVSGLLKANGSGLVSPAVAGTDYLTPAGNAATATLAATVTTNANLTGAISSVGNATTYNQVVPATKGGAGGLTGILRANGSGTVTAAVAADFPTLNQNTTGNAATATLAAAVATNANLTGAITSVGNATTYAQTVPANRGGAGGVSGLLRADGGGNVSAAVAGTDFAAATGSAAYVQNTAGPQADANFNVSGTGTVGGLLRAGSATVGGTLGVGTGATALGQPLGVRAGAASNAPLLGFYSQAGTDKYNFSLSGGGLNLSESNVAGGRLFVQDGTGHVGLGTTDPQAGLHVDRPEAPSTTALGVLLSGGSAGNPSIELRGHVKSPYLDFVETTGLDYSTRLLSLGGTLNLSYGGAATSKPTYILSVDGGINATGQVRANGVVLTSDARFKQHVRPLGGALAAVLALRGVRYEWNALGVRHGGTAGAGQVGLLAQEVEKIYPELVSTDKDGYKAVNYAQLTPVLIEALKEQQQQIEALKARAATAEAAAAQATADHADLLTMKAQLARLLGEQPTATAPARK